MRLSWQLRAVSEAAVHLLYLMHWFWDLWNIYLSTGNQSQSESFLTVLLGLFPNYQRHF